MSLRQIKWLIILIPSLAIGIWEYVRHEFLLPYISMELGNWLAPVLVLVVTIMFLIPLFRRMDSIQEELKQERSVKAVLEERERIARELHDGMAQSLFFMSVQMEQIASRQPLDQAVEELNKTIHEANRYVRQAIHNLRVQPAANTTPWMESLNKQITDFIKETGLHVDLDWSLPVETLDAKEQVELFSCIREALTNIRKHANAANVHISGELHPGYWQVWIEDDGQGFPDNGMKSKQYGLLMIKEKAQELRWSIEFRRIQNRTRMEIRKELTG